MRFMLSYGKRKGDMCMSHKEWPRKTMTLRKIAIKATTVWKEET